MPSSASIQFKILFAGEFPVVHADLQQGHTLYAESGSLVSMSPNIDIRGQMRGGLGQSFLRKLLTGETFFFEKLTAENGPGEVILAPAPPGEVELVEMDGSVDYMVQKGGFLAATEEVKLSPKMQNLSQGLFSGAGFFVARISGKGTMVLTSYGAIRKHELAAKEEYVVSNHHLVAWTASTAYETRLAAKGLITSFTSGQGFVCRFKGPGTVYTQSRSPQALASWLSRYMPRRG
jgi:uncharacterized protein (TIGR00266 family)